MTICKAAAAWLKLILCFVVFHRPSIQACSTKIYLIVLAFTDTSLLMSIFLISKQFRDNAHSHVNEVYWQTIRLTRWFHIAFG